MKILLALFTALFFTVAAYAQHTFNTVIKDAETNQPLPGAAATLQYNNTGGVADTGGRIVITNIPDGKHVIKFTYVGYKTTIDTLIFPMTEASPMVILLQPDDEENELETITVSSTRSSRTIANIPTRVEVISGEELDEKANMKPGDIRMLLAESTGIQTQQTSATSGNSSIRIQGLDGKYTQIIRDGFPLYSGFSGGLGLLQIAPLDLKQVEVIKGSSSTLYGGGAIAGLVNLVSKTPTEARQLNFLLNGTSARGLDVSGFYAQRFKRIGTTIYAAYNHGSPYDPAGIDLTAIPKYNRFTFNPKLFFYLDDKTTLMTGASAVVENRIGGDLHYIQGRGDVAHSYFEDNKTGRYSTQTELSHTISDKQRFIIRNSLSYFDRTIALPDYKFSGTQFSTFSEAAYHYDTKSSDWVLGLNFLSDKFTERRYTDFPLRSYNNNTIGLFAQNTWNANQKLTLESGLRGDYNNRHGFFVLPKFSALLKISQHWSTRLGGGLGYKTPNVFTEDAERIQFRNVLPIDPFNTTAERSYGVNYDVNFRTTLFDDRVTFSINQLFFYTRIDNPILLTALSNGNLQYQQPRADLNTKGTETNVKITFSNFKLFVGYTLADVTQHIGNEISPYPLVSKHRLNNVLMYEIEDQLKLGLEAYYFSPQKLNHQTMGRGYWTTGFLAEKLWQHFSIFINFENFTDVRQTKFGSIYTGNITNPRFKDIYAPLDGFVINGGIKIRL